MAGGRGERLWPMSRQQRPKQFLSLTGGEKTMIQLTVERLQPLIELEDIYIVTNQSYRELVKEQLPGLPAENILAEPMARNTAPCIALAAAAIANKYEDALMCVLPSDHLIKYTAMFLDVLRRAGKVAEKGENLVTIGITPTYPETGYGYIRFAPAGENGSYRVERFVEKPALTAAKEYLSSGQYLWNSGMFVWKLSTIRENFRRFLPRIYEGMEEIRAACKAKDFESTLERCFTAFPSESIDYGIMEKAQDIYVIPGSFGWDDVGSWLALERINRTNEFGNAVSGDVVTINTKDTIIRGGKRLIAAVGVEDLIVVDTEDAVLICAKDSTAEIKKVIENLKICNRNELI